LQTGPLLDNGKELPDMEPHYVITVLFFLLTTGVLG
jgi:hypothetical protein